MTAILMLWSSALCVVILLAFVMVRSWMFPHFPNRLMIMLTLSLVVKRHGTIYLILLRLLTALLKPSCRLLCLLRLHRRLLRPLQMLKLVSLKRPLPHRKRPRIINT